MNEHYEPFLCRLRHDLGTTLPGRAAQYRMAPRPRPGTEFDDTPRPDARQGGVLILLYPCAGQIFLPLILRPNYPGVHSGQVGFPGGGQDEIDVDLEATALREAYEEIGVVPDRVMILGGLTPLYISASNYLVQPTVAWIACRPDFRTDPYEVAKLIETPLSDLLDSSTLRTEQWVLRNRTVEVPFYAVQGHIVWGATAMMLSEFLALPAMRCAPGQQEGVCP